jgi:hypothetical protein
MSYKDASRASHKLAAKYTPPTIDTETFVITNGAKFMIDSDILGTTDPKSGAWYLYLRDRTITRLIYNLNCPVYHILTKKHHDIGYDYEGERCPVILYIDVYVWSVSEGKPVVYLYEVDPYQNGYFLRQTFINSVLIKSLPIEDDSEQEKTDNTFATVYQRITDILFSPTK